MRIKINYDNDDLFCTYSKERIQIGEKYAEIDEEDVNGKYIKPYKLENVPEELEDEDPYFPFNGDLG